jgi:NAD(P)-dependent dehydrogenase (short-subunit alcohol dehydrogenase family)
MKNKVVLVTGAAGKLGTALCRSLLVENQVIAAYHERVPEIPSQVSWPVSNHHDVSDNRAWCVQGDLNESNDIRRLLEVSLARHGRIDAVVNAAADIKYRGRLTDLCYDCSTASKQLAINSIAPFALISAIFHEAWKDERENNSEYNRNVINLSSFSGMYVSETNGQAFYGASKAALNILTLHLALELAPYGIRVNALCPSRFPDMVPTERVVAAIIEIADGTQTGEIVDLTSERSETAEHAVGTG